MDGEIKTSGCIVETLREHINSAYNTLRANENSRNSKASNLKVTRGFCFIKDVTVEPQRAKNPTVTATDVTETESGRIKAIHDSFYNQDSSNKH